MKTRIKLALTIVATILLSVLLHLAGILMNLPHDFTLYSGVLVVLVLFVVAPVVFVRIWRKKVNEPTKTDVS